MPLCQQGTAKSRVMIQRQLKHRTHRNQVGGNPSVFLHRRKSVGIKKVKPAATVSSSKHFGSQGRDKRPVLVTVGAFHFSNHIHSGIQTEEVVFPGGRLPDSMAENVHGNSLRLSLPFEMARPSAVVPA